MSTLVIDGVGIGIDVSVNPDDELGGERFEVQISFQEEDLQDHDPKALWGALCYAKDHLELLKVAYGFKQPGRFPEATTALALGQTQHLFPYDAEVSLAAEDALRAKHALVCMPTPIKETSSAVGYVYLAYCDTGHYKIGRSATPDERIQHFDTQMPVTVSRAHVFPCDNAAWAELSLHNTFQECRHKGEWFKLSEMAVDAIKRIRMFKQGLFFSRPVDYKPVLPDFTPREPEA